MKNGSRGSVMALALLLTVAVITATGLCVDLMGTVIASQKAQTAADFALLSALRVRAESLETVAERWEIFGAPITVTGGTLEAPPDLVPAIAAAAETLRRAMSGFQGRVSSALTVAAEANGADRTRLTQTVPDGLRLGLEAQRAPLASPGFPAVDIDGLWYRRVWSTRENAGVAGISVGWSSHRAGGTWEFSVPISARISWDGDLLNPGVAADGNGGFSPDWSSASVGPLFRPNRYPVFRAEAAAGPLP